jgi:large subunit ribosomal protein L11
MPEKIVSALVEGGKATAGPPIGPTLGQLGINAGKVVAEINEKTKEFEGVTVPVKIIIDTASKEYKIEVGAPSVAALIKKELLLEKGSGKAKEEIVGDVAIDQLIKIAHVKAKDLLSTTPKAALKEIIGTCVTMGVFVNGKSPKEVQKEVDKGMYDDKILGKVALAEISREKIEAKKAQFAKAIEEKRKAEEAKAAAAMAAAAPAEGAKPEEKKEEKKKEKSKEEKKK